jgi:hypothetical protein
LLKKILFCLILCLLAAACEPREAITPESSLWGVITTAGRAPQSDAPALAVDDSTGYRMVAWAGVAEGEARLFARHATTGEIKILALKAYQPYQLRLYPAGDANFHLLWLDRTDDSILPALHTALINAEAAATLEKQTLSDGAAYQYAAAADSQGGLRVVWSSGSPAEPDLYTRLIDGQGRPGFPAKLVSSASYPSVIQTAEGVSVFWLSGRQVKHGKLVNDALIDTETLTTSMALNPGDSLVSFSAALDMTHGYLFWQVVRTGGQPEVWLATGEISRKNWTAPGLFSLPPSAPGDVDTGFNSGPVNIALPIPGSAPELVQWAMPLAGQFASVPVVVSAGDSIAVAYLRWGSVAGYQTLYQPGVILASPLITSDRNNHLYIAWSQTAAGGVSNLRVTGTK